MNPNNSIFSIERTPVFNRNSARNHALELASHLTHPSVLEFLDLHGSIASGASLCTPSQQLPIVSNPTAVFAQLKPPIEELPEGWLGDYAAYIQRVRRTQEFMLACQDMGNVFHHLWIVKDPIVAGLQLYLSSGTVSNEIRQHWLKIALQHPVGSWLAAEGLHTPEERQQILEGIYEDARLTWWSSRIPGFEQAAIQYARTRFDLHSGLIMAFGHSDTDWHIWLKATELLARKSPESACAMIVFAPDMESCRLDGWISTLRDSPEHAYQALRWSQYVWTPEAWERLKTVMKSVIVADRGRWFFHYYRDFEPDQAASAMGDSQIDLLWGAELLDSLGSLADASAFHFNCGRQLGTLGNISASILLEWLNQRKKMITQ